MSTQSDPRTRLTREIPIPTAALLPDDRWCCGGSAGVWAGAEGFFAWRRDSDDPRTVHWHAEGANEGASAQVDVYDGILDDKGFEVAWERPSGETYRITGPNALYIESDDQSAEMIDKATVQFFNGCKSILQSSARLHGRNPSSGVSAHGSYVPPSEWLPSHNECVQMMPQGKKKIYWEFANRSSAFVVQQHDPARPGEDSYFSFYGQGGIDADARGSIWEYDGLVTKQHTRGTWGRRGAWGHRGIWGGQEGQTYVAKGSKEKVTSQRGLYRNPHRDELVAFFRREKRRARRDGTVVDNATRGNSTTGPSWTPQSSG